MMPPSDRANHLRSSAKRGEGARQRRQSATPGRGRRPSSPPRSGTSASTSRGGSEGHAGKSSSSSRQRGVPEGQLEAAVLEGVAYIRVVGLGNALRSLAMNRLLEEQMRLDALQRLVVDLRDCTSLDSTFMGTLLGLARSLDEAHGNHPAVILANPAEHVHSQLAMLGLLDVEPLIVLAGEVVEFPATAQRVTLPELSSQCDLDARLATILEAHQRLVALTPENEARFGPFLRSLLADLQARHR